jgi:hypothetical protein
MTDRLGAALPPTLVVAAVAGRRRSAWLLRGSVVGA